MQPEILTPRQTKIDFDDLKRVLTDRGPRKSRFLKSRRCKILVILGVLLAVSMIALMATTYAIAFTASAKTTSTTTSTVRVPSYQIITKLNDPALAICNAAAGNISYNAVLGNGTCNYALDHEPTACVDFAATTYLNYGNVGYNSSGMTNMAGVGTGIITTPQAGASIVQSIQFQTGNDSANRDPTDITLEGSNTTGTNLNLGQYWTLLYTGTTGLLPLAGMRLAWGDLQNFSNTQPFTSYRVIVTSQRGVDYCTEYAEVHLYGIV